jgi:hypothetical protein
MKQQFILDGTIFAETSTVVIMKLFSPTQVRDIAHNVKLQIQIISDYLHRHKVLIIHSQSKLVMNVDLLFHLSPSQSEFAKNLELQFAFSQTHNSVQ